MHNVLTFSTSWNNDILKPFENSYTTKTIDKLVVEWGHGKLKKGKIKFQFSILNDKCFLIWMQENIFQIFILFENDCAFHWVYDKFNTKFEKNSIIKGFGLTKYLSTF